MSEIRLSVDQATGIIAEAKNDGAFADPMPVDEVERVRQATELYTSALAAAKVGVAAPVVKAIIAIGNGEEVPVPEPTKPEAPEELPEPEQQPAAKTEQPPLDFVVEEAPKKQTRAKKKTTAGKLPIDDFLTKERLPIPSEVNWEITQIPPDLTILSDTEIRRMHGEYHAYFARAAWVLVQEENDLHSAEHMHNIALARAIKEIGGDKITAAKNEAAADAEVVGWKERVLEHGANVRKFKALVSIYESTCNRLSREWTMRSEERGTSGNLFNNR